MESEVQPSVLVVIMAMATANILVRVGGFWLMGHVKLTNRVHRMLAALPGSIVMATIVPIVAAGGGSAAIAVTASILAMWVFRNDFLAMAVGMGAIAALRAGGF